MKDWEWDLELSDLEQKFLARAVVHKDLADKGSVESRGEARAWVEAADMVTLIREETGYLG